MVLAVLPQSLEPCLVGDGVDDGRYTDVVLSPLSSCFDRVVLFDCNVICYCSIALIERHFADRWLYVESL